jgi:hypothetical protein
MSHSTFVLLISINDSTVETNTNPGYNETSFINISVDGEAVTYKVINRALNQ